MSINTVSANTDVEQLVQRLVSQADVNKDGQLSSTEFGSFLTQLIEGVSAKVPNVTGANYATASARWPRSLRRIRRPASSTSGTLNIGADACNGFNRITYCGFSPQDHQGADLNDPMNAKYALQQYLIETNANLNGGAQGIVDALNQKYGAAYGNRQVLHRDRHRDDHDAGRPVRALRAERLRDGARHVQPHEYRRSVLGRHRRAVHQSLIAARADI